ncbi:HlyD family efflux transporter periplasmic adaptor subunit [Micromonospora sp. NBC_01699]|uniref:efflux RND transporter periplasmic adaptor subunit n=1 Tax=Micromonospora sp. NBC_01699 TaxID=2975984 RepID=UPI002E2CFEFB|nr:HlyD family efflux transporter periplasmic adaptor subunit [Micromonospora sp. NBC_01699]
MPVRRLGLLRRPSVLVNAVLGLAIIGGGVWVYASFVEPESSAAATGGTTRTLPVGQGTVTATVSAPGTLRSAATATATFGTGGTVSEILVRVGDLVTPGTVLAKVNPTAANRQLTAARANLDAAKAARDRAEAAGADTTDARSQVTTAQLAVDTARDAVDGTVLRAPMAGTVIAVNGTVGGSVNGAVGGSAGNGAGPSGSGSAAGQSNGSSGVGSSGALSSGGSSSGNASGSSSGNASGSSSGNASGGSASSGNASGGSASSGNASGGSASGGFVQLADLGKLEVSASVAEADATKLRVGQAATIAWNALAGATATGKLTSIDPNASTSNNVVTYGVVFGLDQLPPGVRPGQTVQATVIVGQAQDAIYVNSAALTTVGNRHTATVLENGQPVTRPVEVGLTGDQTVQVTSGLSVGELVVLRTAATAGTGSTGAGRTGGGFTGGGGFPRGAGAPRGGR